MSFDAHKNLAYSLVATAPSPASSGTSLTVTAGQGPLFPATPFNATVWAAGQIPVTTNAEIVRVTNIAGDVLTITRSQETTSARAIIVGDQIAATITVKTLTDIEAGFTAPINVSAGTTSNNLSALTFSNSNGVSFGLNGSVITGTVATNYLTTAARSQDSSNYAGTNGAITGGSITVNTSGVSVNLPAYLTTAMQSNAATISNIRVSGGTTSNLLSAITFSNSNGVSFGLNASTMTASVATSLTNVNVSAGTTSNNLSALVLSNSNNVSFGLNGSTITATISVPAQTVDTLGLYAVGNTTGQSSSSTFDARTLSFDGAGNVSVGYSAGSLIISGGTAAAAPINFSAGTTSNNLGSVVFSNSNGVSFGLNGSTITATVQTNYLTTAMQSNAATISNVNLSAGTTSNNLSAFVLSNSNGVSFGLNGSTVTATVQTNYLTTAMQSNAATISNINLSAGTTSNNLSAFVLSNSNNVSFGLNGSTITATVTVASSQGSINVSAGTTSNNMSAVVFSNSNGISFGLNGSTVTGSAVTVGTATTVQPVASANSVGTVTRWAAEDHAHAGVAAIGISSATNANTAGTTGSEVGTYWLQGTAGITLSQITSNNGSHTLVISGPQPLSYWRNVAAEVLAQTQTMSVQGSTSYMQPFVLDADVSASYLRLLHSFAVTNTTSIATTANATGSGRLFSTLWIMLYTNQSGASSLSLKSVMSASAGLTQAWSLSANANGSQWTLSQSVTHPITGGSSNFTTSVGTSLTNYSLGSLSLTNFTGLQHLDIPFASLISQGNYWLMYGASSSTQTAGSGANFTNLNISNSMVVVSQINSPIGLLGQATNASVQLDYGIGSFSTNAIGTTASLGFSNISSSASYPVMPVQLLRIT